MKKKIAVLFGGRSGEHEVSLRSAEAVMEGLRQLDGIEVLPVHITKEGVWQLHGSRAVLLPDPTVGGLYLIDGERPGQVISLVPFRGCWK
mgnify:CR=1 FL=1